MYTQPTLGLGVEGTVDVCDLIVRGKLETKAMPKAKRGRPVPEREHVLSDGVRLPVLAHTGRLAPASGVGMCARPDRRVVRPSGASARSTTTSWPTGRQPAPRIEVLSPHLPASLTPKQHEDKADNLLRKMRS